MKVALVALFVLLSSGTAYAQTSECGVEGLDVDRFEAALRVERAALPDDDFAVVLERCSAEEAYVRVHVGARVEVRPVSLTDIEPSHRARVLALFAVEVARLLVEWTPPQGDEPDVAPASDIPPPPDGDMPTEEDLVPDESEPVEGARLRSASPPLYPASANRLSRPAKSTSDYELRFQVGPRVYLDYGITTPNLLVRLRFRDVILGVRGAVADVNDAEGLVALSSAVGVVGMSLSRNRIGDFRFEADVLAEAGVCRVQGMSLFGVGADVSEMTFSLLAQVRAAYVIGHVTLGASLEGGWQSGLVAVSQGFEIGGMDGPLLGVAFDLSIEL